MFLGISHLCQSPFLNKVAGHRQVFSCEFWEISKNAFFTEHLWSTPSTCCRELLWQIFYWQIEQLFFSVVLAFSNSVASFYIIGYYINTNIGNHGGNFFLWWSLLYRVRITWYLDIAPSAILLKHILACFKRQKQSSGGVLQKRCSQQFCKIHRKTPVPESLFLKAHSKVWDSFWQLKAL